MQEREVRRGQAVVETALAHLGWVGVCPEGGKQSCPSRSGAPGGAGRGGVGIGVSISRAAGAVCPGGGVAGARSASPRRELAWGCGGCQWWFCVLHLGNLGTEDRKAGRAPRAVLFKAAGSKAAAAVIGTADDVAGVPSCRVWACLCALPSSPPVY